MKKNCPDLPWLSMGDIDYNSNMKKNEKPGSRPMDVSKLTKNSIVVVIAANAARGAAYTPILRSITVQRQTLPIFIKCGALCLQIRYRNVHCF